MQNDDSWSVSHSWNHIPKNRHSRHDRDDTADDDRHDEEDEDQYGIIAILGLDPGTGNDNGAERFNSVIAGLVPATHARRKHQRRSLCRVELDDRSLTEDTPLDCECKRLDL